MKKPSPTEYMFCLVYLVLAFSAIFLVLKGAWLAVGTVCLLIAASSLLQQGLHTRCPACGRLGALQFTEKTPIHEEEVTVTDAFTERVDAVRSNFQHAGRVRAVQTVYEMRFKCRFCGAEHKHAAASTKKPF